MRNGTGAAFLSLPGPGLAGEGRRLAVAELDGHDLLGRRDDVVVLVEVHVEVEVAAGDVVEILAVGVEGRVEVVVEVVVTATFFPVSRL